MPQKFRELSSLDQFRVCRFLVRGETPDDLELATIVLETASHYQTESRVFAALFRLMPVLLAVCLVVFTLPGALEGQVEMMILLVLIGLGLVGNFMLNPWTRPKNVARSVEASRRVIATSGPEI